MFGDVYLALCLKCGQQVMAISVPNAPETCLSRILPQKKYCDCPKPSCGGRAFIADGTFPGLLATVDFGPKGNTFKEIFADLGRLSESNPSALQIKEFFKKHRYLRRVKRFFPMDAPSLLTYYGALLACYHGMANLDSYVPELGRNVVATAPECLAEIDKAVEREDPKVFKDKRKLEMPIEPGPKKRTLRRSGSFTFKFPQLSPQERANLLTTITAQLAGMEK